MWLKLRGDGHRIGKKWQQVLLTLGYLGNHKATMSPNFLFPLVSWDGAETREQMKTALEKTLSELCELKENGFTGPQAPCAIGVLCRLEVLGACPWNCCEFISPSFSALFFLFLSLFLLLL